MGNGTPLPVVLGSGAFLASTQCAISPKAPDPFSSPAQTTRANKFQYFNGRSPAGAFGASTGFATGFSTGFTTGSAFFSTPASCKFPPRGSSPAPFLAATGATAGVPSTPITICTPVNFGTGN